MASEQSNHKGVTRRRFFEHLARIAGLVAVAGGAAALIRRSLGGSGDPTGSPCARCPILQRCSLPEAGLQRRKGLGLVTPVRRRKDGDVVKDQPLCEEGKARQA